MVVDHVCFALKDLQEGIDYWIKVFGYKQMTQIVENTRQKVKVVFLNKKDSVLIKLIEPVESNTTLENFVKRNGGGFHHLCFRCNNIDQGVDELSEKGLLKLVAPEPGEAFDNNKIAFMLGKFGLNIELIDTKNKAKFIE